MTPINLIDPNNKGLLIPTLTLSLTLILSWNEIYNPNTNKSLVTGVERLEDHPVQGSRIAMTPAGIISDITNIHSIEREQKI